MRLSLFFTRGMSVFLWDRHGMLPRELAPYRRLASMGMEVDFISYGKEEDKRYEDMLLPIRLRNNSRGLPHDLYSLLSFWTHRRELKKTDIIKTNQINGWWAAGLARLIFRKPLVVRCGYLLSMNQEQRWKGHGRLRVGLVSLLEKAAFKYADAAIVTTPQMKEEVVRRHNPAANKIFVIPNTVDTNTFKPMPEVSGTPGRLGFVGRFTPQKNIDRLIRAAAGLDHVSLLIIGAGPLEEELKKLAAGLDVKAEFPGVVPNDRLPALLCSCEAFVLPSGWEGMPKALLEAMACGLPVIGTNAPGIRDVIVHERTGFLCEGSVSGLRNAILKLGKDPLLREKTGREARRYVVENYSLDAAVKKEFNLLRKIASGHECTSPNNAG